jgi:monofunctional chorismate mutase
MDRPSDGAGAAQPPAELLALRASIDNLDAAIIHMLAERFKLTRRVGMLKAERALPPSDPGREQRQVERMRRLADEVDLFLAPSAFLRQKYVEHGFPAEKIVVVENGLDVDKLAQVPEVDALPDPPVRPHFGFLGSLAWQKGVHVLIEAFNRLDERASLTIYGSERTFPDYVAELKRLARHPNIRFAGLLDPQQVGGALRRMDCLVVPSLWYENSPLVIQEAFGVGVPVVASRLGALPEKVKDGSTGRLFTAGSVDDLTAVLQDLVAHPQMLAGMAERIVPAPSMTVHAAYLEQVYQSMLVEK